MMKVRAADGYYMPSNFIIGIESNEDINKCIENNEQTFVHEFIHFLQDLILPYSIRNTLVFNRKFSSVVLTGYTEKIIERPFSKWDEDTLITEKQFQSTWGGRDFIKESDKIMSISAGFFCIHTGAKVYDYILNLESGNKYHVGARDFLEYMAHKIESKHWKTNHPEFPYKTVDFLFQHLDLAYTCDEVRMCLVEFCLYNDNPLNQFFGIISLIKKNNSEIFKSYNSCSEYLLNFKWKAIGGFEETISSKTERRLRDLNDSLSDVYGGNNFPNLKKWINMVIDFSKVELSNKFAFTDLYTLSRSDFFSKINLYIRKIGVPLVVNNNSQCISLLPESIGHDECMLFLAATYFMDYVQTPYTQCPLFDICKKENPGIIDRNCSANPIARSTCEVLCPFGVLVKNYGLHNIEWK